MHGLGVQFPNQFTGPILMVFIGTESAGYRIASSDDLHLVIESWGFWDAVMAAEFEREALQICRRIKSLRSCEWNADEMRPQAEHGRVVIRNVMAQLCAMQLADCRIQASNVLTQMQLSRIARESGLLLAVIRDSWQ